MGFPRVAACVVLLLALAGCSAPPDAPAPSLDSIRVGERASYAAEGAPITLDVTVRGPEDVKDADGAPVRALLVERWYNDSSGGTPERGRVVEAVDPASGRMYWMGVVCSLRTREDACERDVAFLALRGLPGLFGRLHALQAGGLPAEEGCLVVPGGGHPIHQRGLPYGAPPGMEAGGDAVHCPGSAFPARFQAVDGRVFVRTGAARGEGPEIVFTDPGAPLRPIARSFPATWDGHRPPSPDHPQPFGYEEAWAWLANESAEFRSFLEAHPDAYLHTTLLEGHGSGGSRDSGNGTVREVSHTRRLTLQAPTGEAFGFLVEKREEEDAAPTYRLLAAKGGRGNATLSPANVTAGMMTPAEATQEALARLNGTWQETQVLTAVGGGPRPVLAGDHFLYNVLVAPPGANASAGAEGVTQWFPYVALVRADTGEWTYAAAPHGFLGVRA